MERKIKLVHAKKVVVGPPKPTRFEKARIVGARALQIAMGAPLLVRPQGGMSSPLDIALVEFESNVLPMTVRRSLPDGTCQDIPISWLLSSRSP